MWRLLRRLWMRAVFDRCDFENDIKTLTNPAEVYRRSEALSNLRLKKALTAHEYEECMELVKTRLKDLEAIRKAVS